MSNADPIVIVAAVRTPLGRFQGELRRAFGAGARRPCDPRRAGAGQARAGAGRRGADGLRACRPARARRRRARRRRGAGLPDATGATTVNKVCGSGMKATMLAHDLHPGGLGRDRRGRRHGIDVERALPAGQGARRLSRRP